MKCPHCNHYTPPECMHCVHCGELPVKHPVAHEAFILTLWLGLALAGLLWLLGVFG